MAAGAVAPLLSGYRETAESGNTNSTIVDERDFVTPY